MPFENTALVPLVAASGFTFWYYRTNDTRAVTLTAGYFTPAAGRLVAGDLILLQSADAMSMVPVRTGAAVGSGLVVDTAAAPFAVNRSAAQRFRLTQAAGAIAMTVLLAPLTAPVTANSQVLASATVLGPVPEVVFSISDAGGAMVRGPATAAVAAGGASATLAAPEIGSGYRLRVQATGYPEVADASAPFTVTRAYAVLLENRASLLTEVLGRLLL